MLLIRDLQLVLILIPPILTQPAKAMVYKNLTLSSPLSSFPPIATITTAPSAHTAINASIDGCEASWDAWGSSFESFQSIVSSKRAAGKYSITKEIYTYSWTDTRFPTSWYTRNDGFHRLSTLPASGTIIISSIVGTHTRLLMPVYQISQPSCCWITAPRCYVQAMSVELFYWPVTPVSGYSNATVASNATEVVTAILEGLTITSPTVVLSYGDISAIDDCGAIIGGIYPGRLLTLHPDSVSSLYGEGVPDAYGRPFKFNFADLNLPHPLSVQTKQCWPTPVESCFLEDLAPYNPRLADPPEIIGLDPAWKSCGKPQFGTSDPPRILVPAQALVNPTPAADAMTKPITAIPASSFPLPAAASLTIADFVSSPSKSPDKSAVPEPDPSPQVDMAQSKGSGPEQEPDTASAYKKPPARDLTLTAPSPQRSFGQGLPDPNNPVTNLIPSKDQLSPENPYANDPLANNKMSADTPVGTGPNPSLPSFNQLEQVVAKVYTAKNGQGFIVAIGSSETLTPYEGKSVATVLGQVISLQGTKGIVVDGTKTVRFAAIQTSARSHHSSEQAPATTAGGGVSNPAPPPATSLLSTHVAQVTSVAVGNDIFDIRTDKDETASLSIMTIQGEIFHEAGVFILTKPNPSLTGVTPSATLTSNIQILMKTEKIVLTDGYGIHISTLAVVYTPATIKTTSLPSAGAGEGNTAIPSINTVDSQTLYHGISQDIFVQGVETVTSMRSSRISNGQGRLLPFLKIVLGSSSTTVQASLPSNIESTKETRADAPRPSITLKELRLGELIVKGFGVGASTTSGGSVTAVAGAGGDGSSAYVNSTDSTSDSKIDNEEDRVMMGRGGRMELTGWGVGLAAFSILMGMWIGIGFG